MQTVLFFWFNCIFVCYLHWIHLWTWQNKIKHTPAVDSPIRHRGRRIPSQCHHSPQRIQRPCPCNRHCSHGFRTWRSSRRGSEGWGPPASQWSWPSGPPGPQQRWRPSKSRRSPAGKIKKKKLPKLAVEFKVASRTFPHLHVLPA